MRYSFAFGELEYFVVHASVDASVAVLRSYVDALYPQVPAAVPVAPFSGEQVRNNKHKKVIPIDQLEALDVPHYPYTFVIVDMRPGNQAILVQQKSSAFKNPDEVAALVTDYCSRVSMAYLLLFWVLFPDAISCNRQLINGL